jgi:hypothetical protein
VLICADQPVILNSNYDNTIWNNGMTGRSIQINNPGKIIAFVSTVCGQSFDTLNAFIFSRTDITSGPDLESCDSIIQLNGAYTNPDSILFNEDVEWKQIDSFPSILFSNIHIKNPTLSNLILDKSYLLEFNVKIGNSCILKDTVKIQYMDCLKDSCAVIIRKSCLPNGMVELTALDQNNQLIQSRVRVRELFWDIQDGPAGKSYSLLNKNPITVSNHTKFKLTSIIYKWKPGYPHTIEYADICERKLSDTIQLNCIGPCADFSFIISSCGDDVDKKNNLNFPSGYCKSVCLNNCNYIVGIFGLDGNLINSSLYSIKWSSGETTAVSNQIGCFNYSLTVEVSKGDCIWYGRYRPECGVKSGIINELTYSPRSPVTEIQLQDLKILLLQKTDFKIYNSTGQIINYFQSDLHNLIPGIYFIETIQNGRRVLNKTFVGN